MKKALHQRIAYAILEAAGALPRDFAKSYAKSYAQRPLAELKKELGEFIRVAEGLQTLPPHAVGGRDKAGNITRQKGIDAWKALLAEAA